MREYFCHKKKITSVSEFSSLITKLDESSEEARGAGNACFGPEGKKVYLYRGVSKTRYPLKTIDYRNDIDLYESEYEMYKDVARVFPKEFLHDTKVIDGLLRLRHYGIPARLIDVTHNPLVALFFAAGGFKAMSEGEKEEDGRVIFFGCEPESIVFSDDRKPCLLAGLEQGVGYDGFVYALDVFRKFLTACKLVENLSDSDLKNLLNELIVDVRKTLNLTTTDFVSIYASISCMELLIDNLWQAFFDEDSTNGLKEDEKEFYDLLVKAYSGYVLGYIQKVVDELKLDADASRFKSVASFLGDFCGLFFVMPKMSNELIERQRGAFLLHFSVARTFNLDDFNLQKMSGVAIKSIIIDSGAKSNILKELKKRGVALNHLFPGLVNYRKEIYSEYSLKK